MRLSKEQVVVGQQMVEERTQLVIEMVRINRLLGYEKFVINDELLKLLDLMRKYGIKSVDSHTEMVLAVLEDIEEKWSEQ